MVQPAGTTAPRGLLPCRQTVGWHSSHPFLLSLSPTRHRISSLVQRCQGQCQFLVNRHTDPFEDDHGGRLGLYHGQMCVRLKSNTLRDKSCLSAWLSTSPPGVYLHVCLVFIRRRSNRWQQGLRKQRTRRSESSKIASPGSSLSHLQHRRSVGVAVGAYAFVCKVRYEVSPSIRPWLTN